MKRRYNIQITISVFTIVFLFSISQQVKAQYNQLSLNDTVSGEYEYILPILGDKVYEKGVDLPLPWGIMVNYFYGVQGIDIPQLEIGFSKGPDDFNLHDITRLVDFEHVKSSAVSLNIRPDVWILPFYNLYGIIGKTWTETDVQLSYPVKIHANVKLDGYSYGVGNTIAFGVGPVFAVLDGNLVWTTLEGFKEPVRTFVFSPRIGHIIDLKTKNDRLSNLGIWIGAMRVGMNGITDGSIPLRDVFPDEFWDNKDQKVAEYYEWYDGLDPMDPKKIIAKKVFNPIMDNIDKANGDGNIAYKLTKEAKQEWNFLIGAQYQYNPHWQLRAEVGLLADRKSALLSINYRFGIHNRTYLQSIAK